MAAPSSSAATTVETDTCTTVCVCIDADLTHSAALPLLLSTTDPSLYPHVHPKYTRVEARYQVNAAAQTILVFPDRTPADDVTTSREPACLPVEVVVLFEPTQLSCAMQAASAAHAPVSPEASAYTPLSRYLDAYLTTVITATVEDVQRRVASALPVSPSVEVVVHLMVCPNCTEGSAGTNMTNANLTPKDAALFAAAAQSVERRWATATTPAEPDSNSPMPSAGAGIRRHKIGLTATVASPNRVASFALALANKHLKKWREVAASNASSKPNAAATTSVTMTFPKGAELSTTSTTTATAAPQQSTRLTPDMIRPDTTTKCEPNDFVKLYQSMLREIVSVSDRRAMAALATFPTMHHLLAHVDHTTRTGVGDDSARVAPEAAAVYARNYGEDRRYNVVNDAVVDALSTDYRATDDVR